LALKQDSTHLHYKAIWPDNKSFSPQDNTEALLRHYFHLDLDLGGLYEQWSKADPNFRKKAPTFTGVRILNQDAWEALLAFICSSNNNIPRISQMVHKLCKHYGPLIGQVDDESLHDFPTPEALTGTQVESHLRELGFGYRAKYIAQTARLVAHEKPTGWLESLRNPDSPGFDGLKVPRNQHKSYKEAHEELLSLTGVGPKVADCVCLMGLGWGESVPVDTHVWQIAQRDYKFGKTKAKTFNKAMYDAVGDHFRTLWGPYAGWAHSVLFTADLRAFAEQGTKSVLPDVKTEVKAEAKAPKVKVEEEITELIATVPTKKRRVVEETVVEQVKLEGSVGSSIVKVERRSKRLRAKASP
jgi:N-glycosylase/DNA lyase